LPRKKGKGGKKNVPPYDIAKEKGSAPSSLEREKKRNLPKKKKKKPDPPYSCNRKGKGGKKREQYPLTPKKAPRK